MHLPFRLSSLTKWLHHSGVLPKTTNEPVLARRAALISRLGEQRALAQDPTYAHVQR